MAERAVKRRSENTKCSCVERLRSTADLRAWLPSVGVSCKPATLVNKIKYAGMAERAVKRRSENTKCSCVERLRSTADLRAWLPSVGVSCKPATLVNKIKYAGMAELADALDSGSSDFTVIQVRPLLPAPQKSRFRARFLFFINKFEYFLALLL